jgi:hypothetical protein
MARIIGGSMIGELSGKLGGNVFARNKSGAYIRQYVIPVDPKTLAQINARANFGAASSSYHSMTSAQKAQWQNFAQNLYLPKNGVNTGQYSGFNAFVSLANTATNAALLNQGFATYERNLTPVVPTSEEGFQLTTTAPSLTIQANIASSSGAPLTYSFEGFSLNTSGTGNALFVLDGASITGPYDINPLLQDANGNRIGFIFYASNPVQQQSMFIANPEKIALFSAPSPEFPTLSATGVTSIGVNNQVIDINNYQSWYSIGDWVRITAYAVTPNGQQIRIGSRDIQITA